MLMMKRAWTTRAGVLAAALIVSTLGLRGAPPEPHRARLAADLLLHHAANPFAKRRVILHGTPEQTAAIAARLRLQIVKLLSDAAVVLANGDEVKRLAAEDALETLSEDSIVVPDMSISNASTAADQVRAGQSGLLGLNSIPGVTGQGVVVAVVDSGISPHNALANKVIANVSLVTGDPDVNDAFGHGTHVAGIITGSASAASSVTRLYTGGIAPGAQLVNVRVLGDDGSGLTSDVIAGIDWVVAHKATYNIRVMNLSLGHPVMEPSATDPLCQAVARAAAAGIVVVASAGNAGKMPNGQMVLGGITSPGNSPLAITVGAINTFGTVSRSDDGLATYSSRGPTRYDLAVKPDLAAPGNKIVSLEAKNAYLPASYSWLHKAGTGSNAYMQLSGTSMAAPMVSGAVALLLQSNPSSSAPQLKLVLQSGATYVPKAGLMGAGAGSANFWAARKSQGGGLVQNLTTTIAGVLVGSSGASFWDAGTLGGRLYARTGIRLLSLLELPLVLLNPTLLHYGDLNLIGLTNPLANIAPKILQYGEVGTWASNDQLLWGDTVYDPSGQQLLWGDSRTTDDNQLLWGDAIMTSADPE